jgi:hypothetical protein
MVLAVFVYSVVVSRQHSSSLQSRSESGRDAIAFEGKQVIGLL